MRRGLLRGAASPVPTRELFAWDGLHTNEYGYLPWTAIVRLGVEREWRRLQRES